MLKLESIRFKIGRKTILDDINLIFKRGCLYGILGPNGSGKTTLLKLIAGIYKTKTGNIFWDGCNIRSLPSKTLSTLISLVPHAPQVQFDYLVKELIEMGLYPTGKREDKNRLDQVLTLVDAHHLVNRKVRELSSGERQRVYIARSLMTDTPVILLDEPTSSLDIKHQLEIWGLIEKLTDVGKTIIVTNHDLAASQKACDSFVILNQGRIISIGTFDEAMKENIIQKVFGVKYSLKKTYELV